MKGKIRNIVVLIVIMLGIGITNVYADNQTIKDGDYFIYTSINDKYAIDISGGKIANKSNIQLYNGNQSDAQKWHVEYIDGYYKISNINSNYVLDIAGGKAKKGTNVQLYKSNDSSAQRWIIKDAGSGLLTVKSKLGNFVLDVKGGKAKNKANIQVWTSNNSKAQKFIFTPIVDTLGSAEIETGTYVIISKLRELLSIDLASGKVANGTNIQMYDFTGSVNEKWYIERLENGYYKIASEKNHNYVLDLASGRKTRGANIQLYKWSGSNNQQFKIIENEDGSYTFINRTNGLALDIAGGKDKNGTNLQMYTQNNSEAQKFEIKTEEEIYKDAKLIITFNSNDGVGSMKNQIIDYNTSSKLAKNTFTREDYEFIGWNTKADGTGTSYSDEQTISNTSRKASSLTLYAKWKLIEKVSISSSVETIDFGYVETGFDGNHNTSIVITNTGNVSITISNLNPIANGPFGCIWFDSTKVIEPGESMTITARLAESSAFANTEGEYNGRYEFIATSTSDKTKKATIYVHAHVVLTEYTVSVELVDSEQNTSRALVPQKNNEIINNVVAIYTLDDTLIDDTPEFTMDVNSISKLNGIAKLLLNDETYKIAIVK